MSNTMENFFIDDRFFTDLDDYIQDIFDGDENEVRALPENWTEKAEGGKDEKVFVLTEHEIIDAIMEWAEMYHEDRFPEYPENVVKKIKSAIESGIDVNKINTAIPELYYPNGEYFTITKQDLVNSLHP